MRDQRLQSRGLAMPDPVDPDRHGRGGAGFLLDALRVRPVGRRVLSTLAAVMFLAGGGMFAYPFATDIYATEVLQTELADQFTAPSFREIYETREIRTGEPLTNIVLPRIGVEALVVEGTSPAALRAGAGHYPTTPLPGEFGNVAIAGHRTTYGKPFNRMDELGVGDEIILETPIANHTYRVVAAPADVARPCPNGACWITGPTDWGVVGPTAGPMLTLTTCHPKGSARERMILRAELVESVPVGAAVS